MSSGNVQQGVKEYLCGFLAGAANIVTGYPLDTVKVRLQSSPGRYKGMLHCARSVAREEGVLSLYRGMSSPLIGGAVECGFTYAVYSRMLSALAESTNGGAGAGAGAGASGQGQGPGPSLRHVPLAAAVSGLTLSVLVAPIELITCRMQMAGSRFQSPLHCLRHLLRTEGPLGLTRGLGMTMAREVPGSMIYFSVYEACKKGLRQSLAPTGDPSLNHRSGGTQEPGPRVGGEGSQPGPGLGPQQVTALGAFREAFIAIASGGAAGCVMWMAILPIDVAKTRRQTSCPGSEWDVGLRRHLAMLWKENGLRAMYSGLTPTLIRAFPSNGAQFAAWELSLYMLSPETSV